MGVNVAFAKRSSCLSVGRASPRSHAPAFGNRAASASTLRPARSRAQRSRAGSTSTRVIGTTVSAFLDRGSVRWSRSFGQLEGFIKVYSDCENTPS